jgi:hypothetical protein
MQVMFNFLNNVNAYIANGTNQTTFFTQNQASSFAYNFTQANIANYYIVITPVSGSTSGYAASISFNYYVYDPNCDTNTVWNGTACVVDYNTYCASLSSKYQ